MGDVKFPLLDGSGKIAADQLPDLSGTYSEVTAGRAKSKALTNGTDQLATINAELAALSTNGVLELPAGTITLSGTLTVGAGKALAGCGCGHPNTAGSASTVLSFPPSTAGVILGGQCATVQDVYLSGSGAGTTAHGIQVQGNSTRVERVSVHGFGGNGYHLDSTSFNCNLTYVDTLHTTGNAGDGLHVTGGSDSNAGTFVAVDAEANTGWGIWVSAAARNHFLSCHCAANTAGGVHDNGNSNTYDVYVESGTGGTFDFGTSSSYGVLWSKTYAAPTLTGSVATAAQNWELHESGAVRQLLLSDVTTGPAGTEWVFKTGSYGAGWLEIDQKTSGTRLFRVDSTLAAAYWNTHTRPDGNGIYDLGGSGYQWRNTYAQGDARPLTTQTASYAVATTDNTVVMNGASLTVTLPDPTTVTVGRRYFVKNTNASALTVASAGTSKTIDGAASASMAQWAHATYVSDGTQWLSI